MKIARSRTPESSARHEGFLIILSADRALRLWRPLLTSFSVATVARSMPIRQS